MIVSIIFTRVNYKLDSIPAPYLLSMPKRRGDSLDQDFEEEDAIEEDDVVTADDDVIDDPADGLFDREHRRDEVQDREQDDVDREEMEERTHMLSQSQSQSQDGASNLFLRNAEQLFPDSFLSQSQPDREDENMDMEGRDQSVEEEDMDMIGDDYEYPLSPGTAPAVFEAAIPMQPVPEPKKPISSWLLFGSRYREKLKADGVKLGFKETAAQIAEAYKSLSSDEKGQYDAEAAADKERYLKEMEEVSVIV